MVLPRLIRQTPNARLLQDNDCCTPIAGTFTGDTICAGQTGHLTFHPTTSPNPPYSLSYNDVNSTYSQINVQDNVPFPAAGNPTITRAYVLLKITDNDNCSTDVIEYTAVFIFPSTLNITPDTSICENGSIQLQVSGGSSYTWGPPDFLNDIHISNPVASPPSPIRYYVTGKGLNNCIVQDSVMVNVLPKSIFKAPLDHSVCQGMSVVLNGNNAAKNHYAWSPITYLDNPPHPLPFQHRIRI